MKLWLILYAGQHIAGTWGPLPYEMKECQSRAAILQAGTDEVIRTGIGRGGIKVPADMIKKLKTWRLSCEYHAVRPPLESEKQP